MARSSHPVVTSHTASRRPTQPPTARPPLSQETVNAYPERCLAPRLMSVPLPRCPSHTLYPSAYIPPHTAAGRYGQGGALHIIPGSGAQAGFVNTAPPPNMSHAYHSPAHAPTNAASVLPPPPYAYSSTPVAANTAPISQAIPVPIPKPRSTTSPPTPEASPPRAAAVSSRRKRTSVDNSQHGASPTT